jgi:hypothetical protein
MTCGVNTSFSTVIPTGNMNTIFTIESVHGVKQTLVLAPVLTPTVSTTDGKRASSEPVSTAAEPQSHPAGTSGTPVTTY